MCSAVVVHSFCFSNLALRRLRRRAGLCFGLGRYCRNTSAMASRIFGVMAVPVFLAKVYFLTLLAKIRRRLSDVTIKQDLNITVRLWTIAKGVLTIRNMN